MMLNLTLTQLHSAIGGELTGLASHGNGTVHQVVVDSREVQPGSVFWALPGARHHGSDFAKHAFDRGACGVVCDRGIDRREGRWQITVGDSLAALAQLARYKRQQFTGRAVAITGSVGKTTTKLLIDTVLSLRGEGISSPHNYNNQVGLPLSMLALEATHDYAAFELGASAAGEIASLAALCAPQIGVITRIGDAHLGHFGSVEAIARAKTELLEALPPDGWAVLNGDDPWLRKYSDRCRARIVWVGRGADCDVTATDIQSRGHELKLKVRGQTFRLPLCGRHYVTPVLAALAVGQLCDVSLSEMTSALSQFQPPAMRCRVAEIAGATIINDSYNACPVAMRAALQLLRDVDSSGQRIVVCGDMSELGPESTTLHRQLGDDIVSVCGADWLVACGSYAADVVMGARRAGMPPERSVACATLTEAAAQLQGTLLPGDAVLVKGSRSMGLENLIEQLQPRARLRVAA